MTGGSDRGTHSHRPLVDWVDGYIPDVRARIYGHGLQFA
jgi:hypothetical protein